MSVTIRPYKHEDTRAILEIINYTILNSTALYDYNIRTYEQQKAVLDDKLAKNFPVIIAEIDNQVVGFGMYGEFRFKEAYRYTVEHSVYIDQKAQGKGAGKLLLGQLILLAKEQKLHTMIGVIDAENESSIGFHEKFGFKNVGTIKECGYKFDRWLDAVFMQLIL